MADKDKKLQDLDQRLIGGIIAALGLVYFVIAVLTTLGEFIGVVAVIVGVIVYFVGVSNKKKWEEVKKDLYPEGEDAGGESS